MEPHEVILYPLMTESATRLIEKENKVVFIVDRRATKKDVKRAVETLYEVSVDRVNTCITPTGLKKAYVKLKPPFKATDLAIKLGII